ncbi:hypothetical protein EV421DRAFT_1729450 [Armillaria borealis]|uniref:Uncharacterized protein n=1 Tax=Armillaria borealis TaxID=47425 RepID=A0AA39KBR7_9AGAR|nr:hypothetical protein EV421DRAFT_1729450 [Armillaria borealis]
MASPQSHHTRLNLTSFPHCGWRRATNKVLGRHIGQLERGIWIHEKAKFSLLLGEPQDISFRADWVNAVGRINGATSQIASGATIQSCVHTENQSTQIRFGASVFQPLDVTANMLDNIIQSWVVDPEHQVGLDQLKKTHQIDCLRVFDVDDKPVPPRDVVLVLKGAMVEVHFSMRHWAIYHNKELAKHVFSCTINQICILK